MRWSSCLAVTFMLLSGSIRAERPSPFTNQSKAEPARATMLAVSSSSRQSFAGNQEIYVAELQRRNGDRELVRLVDQYPGFGLGIRESLLRSRTLFSLRLTREPECDVVGSQVFLPSSDRAVFNPAVREALQARQADVVPCYRAIHGTIRIAKQ